MVSLQRVSTPSGNSFALTLEERSKGVVTVASWLPMCSVASALQVGDIVTHVGGRRVGGLGLADVTKLFRSAGNTLAVTLSTARC
jgi:hypothetical protein